MDRYIEFLMAVMLTVITILVAIITVWLGLIFAASAPKAHSWYSWTCCSDRDCRAISDDSVRETERGYEVLGQVIPYNDPRVQVSQDAQFHICQPHPPEIRCLYVPGRSF